MYSIYKYKYTSLTCNFAIFQCLPEISSTPENSQIEAKNEALVQIIYPFQQVNLPGCTFQCLI